MASRILFSEEFLREVGMSGIDDKDNKEQAEEFAFTTDAVTYILLAAGCPNKFRDYIDCLIGLAGNKVEFDTTDKEIERHRKILKLSNSRNVKAYWARDRRRDLLKWQKDTDFKLLDIKRGKYDSPTKTTLPSHYKFYLIEYVQQVIANAKKDTDWEDNKALALNQAAQELINNLRVQPKDKPEEVSYINPHNEVVRILRTVETHLAEAVRLQKRYDFGLYKDNEALVNSIEDSLSIIRKKGFVDLLDMKIFSGIKRPTKP